jgi:hypothetical protein
MSTAKPYTLREWIAESPLGLTLEQSQRMRATVEVLALHRSLTKGKITDPDRVPQMETALRSAVEALEAARAEVEARFTEAEVREAAHTYHLTWSRTQADLVPILTTIRAKRGAR